MLYNKINNKMTSQLPDSNEFLSYRYSYKFNNTNCMSLYSSKVYFSILIRCIIENTILFSFKNRREKEDIKDSE